MIFNLNIDDTSYIFLVLARGLISLLISPIVLVILVKATIAKVALAQTVSIFVSDPEIIGDRDENIANLFDRYRSIQVKEHQLQNLEIARIEIATLLTKSIISFRLRPEMRNQKVKVSGVLDKGKGNLFVKINVI